MLKEHILILDFGSQYTQLIAKKIHKEGVFTKILLPEQLEIQKNTVAIVISGGPSSVYNFKNNTFIKKIKNANLPILGICFGFQLLTQIYGGKIQKGITKEYGKTNIHIKKKGILYKGINNKKLTVWMSHQDVVIQPPKNFEMTAYSENNYIVSFENKDKKIFGVQFHPEVFHTQHGDKILKNFLSQVKVKEKYNLDNEVDRLVNEIRKEVGNKKVGLAISGGVDSTVLAVLLKKALGNNVYPIFINNGLLRKNEVNSRLKMFKKLGLKVVYVNGSKEFLSHLKGVEKAKEKRKIIGKIFIKILERELKEKNVDYLAQGTLYPDMIESQNVVGKSSTIKLHHNVGGLPKKLRYKLLEPFKYFFKDEVREIGKLLKIPNDVLYQHPFPGPGLAVRIPGEITSKKLKILKEADAIFIEELKKYDLYYKIWQAFVVLLPIKTTGVKGDVGVSEYAVSLRAINSIDGMTAEWYPLPHEFLKEVSTKITNKVDGITRVLFDISNKPPATIEWE